jgi:hypothetical protein
MNIIAGLDKVVTIRRIFGIGLEWSAGTERNCRHQQGHVF